MKKTLSMILAALMVLSLAACAKSTEPAETTSAAETAATVDAAAASATLASGEEAGLSDAASINAIFESLDLTPPETLGTVKKLGQYTGLELVSEEAKQITDADVDAYLEQNIMPNFTEQVDGPIQNGDTANIDYEGKKDGVAFDGGTDQGYDLVIGSGNFIPGFEDGLIGKKAGETVDLNLTFPTEYHSEELAGQSVVFTVKINSISRPQQLTDALVPQIDPESKTVAELKANIKKFLQEDEDLTAMQSLYYVAATKVIQDSEIETDPKAVAYTCNTYLSNYAAQCQQYYGMDVGTVLTYMGGTYADVRSQYETISEEAVQQRLVLQEIAKKENLEVTDDDLTVFAGMYGYTKDQLLETVGEEQAKQLALEDKASQFIVSHSTVTYEKAAE